MKSLVIPNGGMPFEGGDLKYLQEGLSDAIKGIIKPFQSFTGHAVLSNKNPVIASESSLIVQPTWVVITGNLLQLDAWQATGSVDPGLYGIFVKDTYYDPAGQDVFDDGLTKDTYEVREAEVLLLTAGSGNHIKLSEADDYLAKFMTHDKATVIEEPGVKIEVCKQGNIIVLQGHYSDTLSVTLSEFYRPKENTRFASYSDIGSARAMGINANGELFNIDPITGNAAYYFSLSYFV